MPLDVARRGTLDVKDPPLKAIVATNDTYEAGYHKGNAGGLDAIDTDLATGNIKSGITMFGKVGSADVQDISDATAVEAEVLDPETFYAVGGGIRTGTMPTVALAPGSSAYPAGYHAGDVGGLPAIDADLVTGNIKSGKTIFNVAGHNDVRDISDADLVEAEAPTGKFFYAVSGGIRTGSGTKTLNPANETVAAGYYAATTLSAVDAELATGNIKSGIVIFGFTGPATVQDISAADAVLADVKNGKTFFSDTGGIKTGNLATVALNPALNEYPAGYHAGEASLTAVDAQLAAGNIKDGVVIFGVTGTLTATLIDDTEGSAVSAITGTVLTASVYRTNTSLPTGGDGTTLATKTLTFAADSRAVVVGAAHCSSTAVDRVKIRLYAGGVNVAESGFVPAFATATETFILTHIGVLLGAQICKVTASTWDATTLEVVCGKLNSPYPAAIGIGSIKT